jgi:glycosyltransferase involved in cell wall biosynthesis
MHLPLAAYPERAARLRRQVSKPEFKLLVVISESLRRDYERELPELKGRVLVAHDGADPVVKAVQPATLSGEFKVGYVGHLYPGKGMEIIGELAASCPWATFHIVGGTAGDIHAWKTRHSDATNLIFHGHVDHAHAAGYIAAMDVVLAPYLRVVRGNGKVDGNLAEWMSPLKIFEYMANAKPIVASDLPVLREVLADGRSALLRAPEDIDGWTSALRLLKQDSALRMQLGIEARKVFLESYTWHQRARAIFRALDAPTRPSYV